jgi:hypothetical protein
MTKYVLNFRYKGAIVEDYSHPLRTTMFAEAQQEADEWLQNPDNFPGNWDNYRVDEV